MEPEVKDLVYLLRREIVLSVDVAQIGRQAEGPAGLSALIKEGLREMKIPRAAQDIGLGPFLCLAFPLDYRDNLVDIVDGDQEPVEDVGLGPGGLEPVGSPSRHNLLAV